MIRVFGTLLVVVLCTSGAPCGRNTKQRHPTRLYRLSKFSRIRRHGEHPFKGVDIAASPKHLIKKAALLISNNNLNSFSPPNFRKNNIIAKPSMMMHATRNSVSKSTLAMSTTTLL
ncbi:hypothetical protein GGI42DRAFT_324023 [Trichoderma sp. SZMC 28013]